MDGIIVVDKPSGITSFDVVRKVKKETNLKKVGHTGTLDPLASGVLPICIGKATKVSSYFLNGTKEYDVTLKLGIETETYDKEGEVIATSDTVVNEELIKKTILSFVGEIGQVPPKYSALKVNGERAYNLARKGIDVKLKSRQITIHRIDNIKIEFPYASFTVFCSKGTYIRSLCYDIGRKLEVGATMWELRRTKSGNLELGSSIPFDELNKETITNSVLEIDKVLLNEGYKPIKINNKAENLLSNGVCIKDKSLTNHIPDDLKVLVYNEEGKFLGIAHKTINGLKAEKIFFR